jgi:signal transduction histidine kinase
VESQSAAFDLREFVNETAEEMKGLLKKGQQIITNYNGAVSIESDKKLLKNVIINLITNAIKFSEEGKKITISTAVNSDQVTISVKDEGIGIAEDDLDHLFTSFFRGGNALNIQGTGLGLHIVKRYLDLIGGDVDVKSGLDEGTTVTINIPTHKPSI